MKTISFEYQLQNKIHLKYQQNELKCTVNDYRQLKSAHYFNFLIGEEN